MKLEINKTYEIGDKNFRLNEDLELIELTNKSIYDLKYGDKYYSITSTMKIFKDTWKCWNMDEKRLESGNVFLTEEEAQFELERIYTISKIKKWKYDNDDYEFTCAKENYCIEFNLRQNQFTIYSYNTFKDKPNYLYFSSKEKARECLEFIGEENWKKYVLEIEE